MKTIIVNVPDKDESVVAELFKKLHLKSKVLTDEELEDKLITSKTSSEIELLIKSTVQIVNKTTASISFSNCIWILKLVTNSFLLDLTLL